MDYVIVNKKEVRQNHEMRKAQKAAKRKYGRARMAAPKLRVSKIVGLQAQDFISFVSVGEDAAFTSESEGHTEQQLRGQRTESIASAEQLITAVEQAGLTGLSGNGFSTAEKLRTLQDANAAKRYLIINAVECDPGLIHDEWLLENHYEEVKKGIEVLENNFSFERTFLASRLIGGYIDGKIELVKVPNRYPMGQEKVLIHSMLGADFAKDDIPAEHGILVINLQTVFVIGRIADGTYQASSRYLTAANLDTAEAMVIEATVGMDAAEIAEKVFPDIETGIQKAGKKVFVGGGSMSAHPLAEGEQITAATNWLAYGRQADYSQAVDCKGCGGCTGKCPAGVDVKNIIRLTEKGQKDGFEKFHPELCIGCGACTYVCAAGKNVQEVIARINGKI